MKKINYLLGACVPLTVVGDSLSQFNDVTVATAKQ